MKDSQSANFIQSFIADDHQAELKASAIDYGIAALNFWSFDGTDENELDQVFSRLKLEPEHNNNGTLSGKTQQELSNILYGGGWVFEGHSGVSVKLNSPRKGNDKDGKEKVIKYESVRGSGNQQLFIPHVSIGASKQIVLKSDIEIKLVSDKSAKDEGVNPDFWELFMYQKSPLIITEGAKKACALISAGYPAIALNGVDGFGTNVHLENESGEVLKEKNPHEDGDRKVCVKDADGNNTKSLIPALEELVSGRDVILAFDVDDNPATKKKVDGAKSRFRLAVEDIAKSVTQIKWKGHKGVDDLIATEGVKAFDKAYKIKAEVKLPKPPKPPKPASLEFRSSIETGLVVVELDKDGKESFDENGKAKSERIGNHLIAIATLNNTDKNESAFLLEFQTFDGSIRRWTMPRGYISGDGNLLITELYGREYSFIRDKKSMLLDYLSTLGASIEQKYVITDSSGWVDKSFVLPHKTHGDENLRFRDVDPSPDVITETKGTLQGWKDTVAARCGGNSRLIFGLGCGFAAPLMPIVNIESGGFHLFGTSSKGKTSIMWVVASVIGLKDVPHWRTTSNGLESIATAFNHLSLLLDEIHQADPKDVGNIIYMLGNGQGKARMTKNLTNRKPKTWQELFLSSGEVSVAEHMARANDVQKGGQEARLPDVPAIPQGSQHGCFETIHGADEGGQFAEALEAAAKEQRGTALDAFLSRLIVDISDPSFAGNLSAQLHLTAAKLSEGTKDSVIGRVAKRFALVQIALGLAHKYGLLPFDVEQIGWAISECFHAWLAHRGGDGSIEIKNAIKRIERLFVANEISDRVDDLRDGDESKVRNLLAHRKCDSDGDTTEFWVPPSVFEKELCEGVNKTELIAELQKMGWLLPSTDGRPTVERQRNKKKSRFFVFIAWKS
jgi:putative DNA primase/helicase